MRHINPALNDWEDVAMPVNLINLNNSVIIITEVLNMVPKGYQKCVQVV